MDGSSKQSERAEEDATSVVDSLDEVSFHFITVATSKSFVPHVVFLRALVPQTKTGNRMVTALKGVTQKASDASKGAVAKVKHASQHHSQGHHSVHSKEPAAMEEMDGHDVATSPSEHSKMSKVTFATKKVCYSFDKVLYEPPRWIPHSFAPAIDSFQASECHEKDNHVHWERHASEQEESEAGRFGSQ